MDHRLLDLAVGDSGIGELEAAGFVVEQNGLHDTAERAVAIAVSLLHAVDVACGGIRGHEALNHPSGNIDRRVCVAGTSRRNLVISRIRRIGAASGEHVVCLNDFSHRGGVRRGIRHRADVCECQRQFCVLAIEKRLRIEVMINGAALATDHDHRRRPRSLPVEVPILATEPDVVPTAIGIRRGRNALVRRADAAVAAIDARTHIAMPCAVGEASEDAGQLRDVVVVVSRDGQAFGTQDETAIWVTQNEADGEELHDLTSVVFIRADDDTAAGIVSGAVGDAGEVNAHHRVQRHLLQKGAVLAESTLGEHVPPVCRAVVPLQHARITLGDDGDLAQGLCHTLTKLVLALQHHRPPLAAAIWRVLRVIAARVVRVRAAAVGHGHAVHIGDTHRAAVLQRIVVVVDRFVASQRKLLRIRRHDEFLVIDRRRERRVHLRVHPRREAVDVGAAARDGCVHFGPDLRVKRRRAAHRGLVHETPDVTLQRLARGIRPKHATEGRRGEIRVVRVKLD